MKDPFHKKFILSFVDSEEEDSNTDERKGKRGRPSKIKSETTEVESNDAKKPVPPHVKSVKVVKKEVRENDNSSSDNRVNTKKQGIKKPLKASDEKDENVKQKVQDYSLAADSETEKEVKSKKEQQKSNLKSLDIKEKGIACKKVIKAECESEVSVAPGSSKKKIDVYLKDSRREIVKTEQEEKLPEKKQFKTFEEAFLYSISDGNLGKRNAAKRNYEQLSTVGRTGRSERSSSCGSPFTEIKTELDVSEPDEKKAKIESVGETFETVAVKTEVKSEANLEEDIEKLKHQTDQFLQKYNRENSEASAHIIKLDIPERNKKATNLSKSTNEHNYVCKKKLAAKNMNEQKNQELNVKTEKTDFEVPQDLVEKHKDLGQELIQLTHDIIQQQSTKTHKYLEQTSSGLFNYNATSDMSVNRGTASGSSVCASKLFGDSVSSRLMQSVKNPSNPMYCKEFGKNSSSSSLDFSQLANQADQKTKTENSDMNLLFTIHKLSSSLQGQGKSEIVPKTVQHQLQHATGSQGKQGSLSVDVNLAEKGRKMFNEAKSPAILRSGCSSLKSPGQNKMLVNSPTSVYHQQVSQVSGGNGISPGQLKSAQLSPQGKSTTTSFVRIQSPTGMQHRVQIQGQQYSSPPILSSAESPVFTQNTSPSVKSPSVKSPPVLSPIVNTSPASQSPVHNTLIPAVNIQPSQSVPVYNTPQSGTYSQHIEQGQIVNSHGIRMISNGQKLIPIVTASQNQNTVQSVSGQIINAGHILNPMMVRQQFGTPLQPQVVAGNQGVLLQPQVNQQNPGSQVVTQSPVRNVITNPQLLAMANQGLVQFSTQGTATNPAGIQSRIVRNGNQTFLLNIPVMRPTTSNISGSVVQMPAGNNIVTAVSSQGKQNQVGQILLQQQNSVSNNGLKTAAPVLVVADPSGQGVRHLTAFKTVNVNQSLSSVLTTVKNHITVQSAGVSTNKNSVAAVPVLNPPIVTVVSQNSPSLISAAVQNTTNLIANLNNTSNSQKEASLNGIKSKKDIVDAKELKHEEVIPHPDDPSNSESFSPFLKEAKSDVSLHRKSVSVSPPPRLQSPNKQLVPQPIVPISQTFASTMSYMKPLFSDPSLYSGGIPSQLLEGEESEDVKPPVLEMEPPMLEMEAPILKLETEGDCSSVKSEPDTLSNYSVGSNPMSLSSSLRSELDGMPMYPMTTNGLDPSSTIIQTQSYNAFSGQGKQSGDRKRRKSATDGVKENKLFPGDFMTSPSKKVGYVSFFSHDLN